MFNLNMGWLNDLLFKEDTHENYTREFYIGRNGEKKVKKELGWAKLFGVNGKALSNIYIPMTNGETTEIDLIYITKAGIFVIESKNYKGWIFGTDTQRTWTEVLYAGRKGILQTKTTEKHHFYNPIMQNKTHINWLQRYIKTQVPMFSLIVFSDRCELKEINLSSSPNNVYVCLNVQASSVISSWYKKNEKCLSKEEIEELYNKLLPLTDVDKAIKIQHNQDVQDKKNGLVCPYCKSKLVLRTAMRGNNVGKQFYGCSNYPKCKYTKNID